MDLDLNRELPWQTNPSIPTSSNVYETLIREPPWINQDFLQSSPLQSWPNTSSPLANLAPAYPTPKSSPNGHLNIHAPVATLPLSSQPATCDFSSLLFGYEYNEPTNLNRLDTLPYPMLDDSELLSAPLAPTDVFKAFSSQSMLDLPAEAPISEPIEFNSADLERLFETCLPHKDSAPISKTPPPTFQMVVPNAPKKKLNPHNCFAYFLPSPQSPLANIMPKSKAHNKRAQPPTIFTNSSNWQTHTNTGINKFQGIFPGGNLINQQDPLHNPTFPSPGRNVLLEGTNTNSAESVSLLTKSQHELATQSTPNTFQLQSQFIPPPALPQSSIEGLEATIPCSTRNSTQAYFLGDNIQGVFPSKKSQDQNSLLPPFPIVPSSDQSTNQTAIPNAGMSFRQANFQPNQPQNNSTSPATSLSATTSFYANPGAAILNQAIQIPSHNLFGTAVIGQAPGSNLSGSFSAAWPNLTRESINPSDAAWTQCISPAVLQSSNSEILQKGFLPPSPKTSHHNSLPNLTPDSHVSTMNSFSGQNNNPSFRLPTPSSINNFGEPVATQNLLNSRYRHSSPFLSRELKRKKFRNTSLQLSSSKTSSSSNAIFVNFTSKDSKKLLSGVAPSGSSKRKKNANNGKPGAKKLSTSSADSSAKISRRIVSDSK
ncbi:hypothetical protein O181_028136 [Austropuccinia psidii MF-1]|uniref:Uncharacterized protein n=1 Tax=Austropuccinia psidii MF-1 TaxID=1389203 RepID=A0A9Q3CTV8_9BASI|nr:hypothetical protein [Austropuccinia psidii MF-1]